MKQDEIITLPRSVGEQALSTLEGWSNYDSWVWPDSALATAKRNTAEVIPELRAALDKSIKLQGQYLLEKLLYAIRMESNAKHNLNEWLRASPSLAVRVAQAEDEWVKAAKYLVNVQMAAEDYIGKSTDLALTQPTAKQEPTHWQPIETAPKGRIVLVHYKNRLGNGRTMRARYYLEDTLESDTTESGWADEGWYEESEAYEYLMPLDGDPTHWMPLPPPPGAAQDASNISAEEATADDSRDSQAPMPEEVIRIMCKQPWLFETIRQWVRITERYHNIGTFVQSGESSGD